LPSSVHEAPAFPAGCWHAARVPLHWSTVHGLLSSVHAVPGGLRTSAGHVELEPVQVSAGSHTPVEARQLTPAFPVACWQRSFVPSHLSVVQALPSSVQAVPFVFLTSVAGHVVLDPVQVSARSHSPAAARHVVPELPAACWQRSL